MRRSMSAVIVSLIALLAPATCAWASDDQTGAEPFFYGTTATQDTTAFSVEPGEPQTFGVPALPAPSCVASTARTEWLTLEGTGTPITIDTAGSAIDTMLAVYTGSPAATEVACNDDVTSAIHTSSVTFLSDANTTYRVQVGTSCSDAITCAAAAGGMVRVNAANTGAPANDLRANATPLQLNSTAHESNATASVEAGEPTSCLQDGTQRPYGKTVWFSFQIPAAGRVTFRAGGAGADSVIAMFAAASPSALDCNDNDVSRTLSSTLTLDVAPGGYVVALGGYGTSPFSTIADFPVALDFTPNPEVIAAPAPPAVPPPADAPGAGTGTPARVGSSFAFGVHKLGTGLRLTRYSVLDVPAGGTVELRCGGTGCPFTVRRTTVAKAKSVSLLSLFKHRRLRSGTTLTLRVTAPSLVGLVRTQKVGGGRLKTTTQCLQPGAAKPSAC